MSFQSPGPSSSLRFSCQAFIPTRGLNNLHQHDFPAWGRKEQSLDRKPFCRLRPCRLCSDKSDESVRLESSSSHLNIVFSGFLQFLTAVHVKLQSCLGVIWQCYPEISKTSGQSFSSPEERLLAFPLKPTDWQLLEDCSLPKCVRQSSVFKT